MRGQVCLIWDQPIGGIEMPWVAGKSLFLQTIDGRLYALRRSDGAVRWVADLPGALPKGVVASKTFRVMSGRSWLMVRLWSFQNREAFLPLTLIPVMAARQLMLAQML